MIIMLIETIKTVGPLLLAFCIGSICRRKNLISNEGNFCFKDLLSNLIFPALLFNSFLFAEYSISSLAYIITTCALFYISYAAIHFLNLRIKGYEKYSRFVMTTWEGGSVGISFANILFGTAGVTLMALLDLGHAFFLFAFLIPLLRVVDGGKTSIKATLKTTFTTPAFDAIICGLILGLLNVDKLLLSNDNAYGIYKAFQNILSEPSSFVMMFTVGYDFDIKKEMIAPVFKTLLIRIILFGTMALAAIFIIFRFVPYDRNTMLLIVLAFSLPISYGIPTFSRFEGSREYVSSCVSLTTIFTLIVFSIISFIK